MPLIVYVIFTINSTFELLAFILQKHQNGSLCSLCFDIKVVCSRISTSHVVSSEIGEYSHKQDITGVLYHFHMCSSHFRLQRQNSNSEFKCNAPSRSLYNML
ncbi:hypothetical protein ILYODFUR_006751 [Ilyodon furcidens]|uniref:Uncharacterized protein n=1 Tax=Ilyodon furcidens TaxID=33524 RepID=A0ABV0U5Z1_9TELE